MRGGPGFHVRQRPLLELTVTGKEVQVTSLTACHLAGGGSSRSRLLGQAVKVTFLRTYKPGWCGLQGVLGHMDVHRGKTKV